MAESLKSQAGNEAALRSAVSRAYYAAYVPAYDFLCADGVRFARMAPQSHKQVWDKFLGRGRVCAAIGTKGNDLRWRRQKADYDGSATISEKDAEHATRLAKLLLEWLKEAEEGKRKSKDAIDG